MSVLILKNLLQAPRLQTIHFASIVVQGNNYCNQPRIIKNPTTASLKRGTGGRSSFNGIVCTVFGSTGLVGRYLLNRLGKIGTQLIIPYRTDFYDCKHLKLCGDLGQVFFHPYNLCDEEAIYKSMKYSNVVVNLVSRDWPTHNFSYHDVHVDAARRFARIAKEAGVEHFIHLSDLNASPNPKPVVMKNGSQYLRAKWEGECAVREEFPEATIIRPATIYGMEDRFLYFYCNKWINVDGRPILWKKGEESIKQPVHVSDVAAGITAIILDDSSMGKTYQFVGPKRYKLRHIVEWLQKLVSFEWDYYQLEVGELENNLLYQWKISLNEMLGRTSRIGCLHWERIERDSTTDVVLEDLPKLEDLGIQPVLLEQQAAWDMKIHQRDAHYFKSRAEFKEPPVLESLPM